VDPRYTLIDDGEGNDDHPHADLRAGESDTAVPVLPVIPEPVPTLCGQGGILDVRAKAKPTVIDYCTRP
jgi:hypothetical protein